MEISSIINFIPKKISGIKSRSKVSIDTSSSEEAIALFELAKLRMLAVNHWHDMAGVMSAVFQLTDNNGGILNKNAEAGNFIRIDIPRPVTLEDDGYDWVKIESIVNEKNENEEYIILQVKPISDPAFQNDGISHFYKKAASTNFIVERKGTKVTAYEQRKSEIKLDSNSFLDRIRNVIVLNNTQICLSDLNWKALLEAWVYYI